MELFRLLSAEELEKKPIGDASKIMYRIDKGRIKPSKMLSDSVASMIKGNEEFVMVDDQKVVYETAMSLAKKSSNTNKNVLIVQGGPGTGKSVVAINLLVNLIKIGLNSRYVTKNSAPREVYQSKLTGTLKKTEISNLFCGSGSFTECDKNAFDALIVDEAHRLNEKSGLFKNLGENQIKEIIDASNFIVFFVDEDQKVTFSDIGEIEQIERWAKDLGANIFKQELISQFRCNGSGDYVMWLDETLQITEDANVGIENIRYDFKIVGSPSELREIILEKNKEKNKARLVAGYCWDWKSKRDEKNYDIVDEKSNFHAKWNLASDGSLWLIKPDSVNEVGCIHTCQGLEMDYVGVIVGPDLVVRNGEVVTDPAKRAKTDTSLKGYKKLMKEYIQNFNDKGYEGVLCIFY